MRFQTVTPVFEDLEPRLLLSGTLSLGPLAPPEGDTLSGALGFDEDTSQFVDDNGDNPTGDATPTGNSYMLTEHWGGTWHDVEKSPIDAEDDLLCWAATAANILRWTGWGIVDGMNDPDTMFQYFEDHWTDLGGLMRYAWDWWFDGTNTMQGVGGWSQVDVPGGNFYPSENFNDYYHSGFGNNIAMQMIGVYLQDGNGVGIGLYGAGAHAITVWGVNYTGTLDSPTYVGIWVTDSDDNKSQVSPPDRLRYYEVQYSGGLWWLQDYYGSNGWYIGAVQTLEQNPGAVNNDPVITGLPDRTLNENTSLNNTIDLWAYASDVETADGSLSFSITGNTDTNCGVTIDSNRYIDINPTADWTGFSDVTIEVDDGEGGTDTDTFRVTVSSASVDLTVALGMASFPATSTAGDGGLVQLVVTNGGNVTGSGFMDLQLWASPDGNLTGGNDYQIAAWNNQYFYLPPAGTAHYWQWVTVPGVIPAGTYDLIAVVDSGDDVAESAAGELNNETVVSNGLVVQNPDLTVDFGMVGLNASPLPSAFGYAQLVVTNDGSVRVSGPLDLQLWATPDGNLTGDNDYLLKTITNAWHYLLPGWSTTHYAYFSLPGGIVTDDYSLLVVVDSGGDVAETNENNNTAISASQYAVRAPFIDLTGAVGTVGLPDPSTTGSAGLVQLQVTNGGNITASSWMSLELWVSGDGDLAADAPVGGADDFLVSDTRHYVYLTPGQTGTYYLWVTLPSGIPAGGYDLVLVVDADDDVAESTAGELNNETVSAGALNVTNPDLTAVFGTVSLSANTLAGAWGWAQVVVTNGGTIRASGYFDIQVWATNDGDVTDSQGSDYLVTTLQNQWLWLDPGNSWTYTAYFNLPAVMTSDDYNLLALLDSADDVTETNENNNTTLLAQQYTVAAAFVDLTPTFGTIGLPTSSTTGAWGLVQILMTNAGNVTVSGLSNMQLWLSPDGDLSGGNDYLVATSVHYVYLPAGAQGSYYLWVVIPNGIPVGTYDLIAVIDSGDDITESPAGELNNTVISAGRYEQQ